MSVDTTTPEIACVVCSRLHCQERRHALHPVFGPQHVSDVHECLHLGRLANTQETGRDVENVEGARAGIPGHPTGVSS